MTRPGWSEAELELLRAARSCSDECWEPICFIREIRERSSEVGIGVGLQFLPNQSNTCL